jgi:L-ascorbate metabolism protein UlaG (beta-lactamase superfamily)
VLVGSVECCIGKEVGLRPALRLTGVFLLVMAATSSADHAAKVHFVANEGFLIEVGAEKVLIDALFDNQSITWCHVPDETTLRKMENAESPFDGVGLILVTHAHPDHFSPQSVIRRLRNDASAVVVGPPQMVTALEAAGATKQEIDERIIEVDLELFDSTKLDVAGIGVRAYRLRHSRYEIEDPKTGEMVDRHRSVENLVYLIEIGGKHILHVGDAVLSQNLELFKDGVFENVAFDIVFLEYFDWSEETKAVLDRWVNADHTVFMHLPREADEIESISQRLELTFPSPVVFDTPLQIREF